MTALPRPRRPLVLDVAEARRIALAAQGFAHPRPAAGTATVRHLQRVIDRVGVVQIDSVNVLVRSHYLPFFSRLGPYDRSLLDRARDRAPRRLVEYWAHEASLLPPALWALHDHRMRDAAQRSWGSLRHVARERPELVESVCREVERRGPMTAREVQAGLQHDQPRRAARWGWNWSEVKAALEYLFWAGRISSAGRTASFERRYAALAVVAPPRHRAEWLDPEQRPSREDAFVELVRVAARACGIATQADLADYFRIAGRDAGAAIAVLVADGELQPVTVTGWNRPACLHSGARRPAGLHVQALVSPFDSLVWRRERTEALFGVRYRLEVYTPAPKRVHGYYVLPFVYGDRIVARCDLKADRRSGSLLVQRLTWEPDAPRAAADGLEQELASLAGWLGLSEVSGPQGTAGEHRAGRDRADPGTVRGMSITTSESAALRAAIAAHRDALDIVLRRYRAANPRLFGSVARGGATRDSDIDLLVDLLPDGGNELLRVAGIAEELSDLLGRRVDVVAAPLLRGEVSAAALTDAVAV